MLTNLFFYSRQNMYYGSKLNNNLARTTSFSIINYLMHWQNISNVDQHERL